MTLMIQWTVLLLVGLVAAKCWERNASRAHAIICWTLLAVILVPVLSLTASKLGWGFLPAQIVDSTQETNRDRPSIATRNHSSIPSDPSTEPADTFGQVPSTTVPEQSINAPESDSLVPPPIESQRTVQGSESADPQDATESVVQDLAVSNGQEQDRSMFSRLRPALIWTAIVVWFLMSGYSLIRLVIGFQSAMSIRAESIPCRDTNLAQALDDAREKLRLANGYQLLQSSRITCPSIWGWWKPAVILPRESKSKRVDWEGLLIHELAHHKRRDHWASLLTELCVCILPWHPLVRLIRRTSYRLSEHACDQWAVSLARNPEDYAESLLAFAPGPKTVLQSSRSSSADELRERIGKILGPSPFAPSATRSWRISLAAISVMLLVICSLAQEGRLNATIKRAPSASSSSSNSSNERSSVQDDLPGDLPGVRARWSNEQWIECLVNVPADSRWHVGATLGGELAKMRDDRALLILAACWDDIEPSVAQQMLKGFQPSFRFTPIYSDVYFDVMNLGMRSPNQRTQSFATTYLHDTIFRDFDFGGESYDEWFASLGELETIEVIALETNRFAKMVSDPEQTTVEEFLDLLGDEYRFEAERNRGLNAALVSAGAKERAVSLLEMNVVQLDDYRVKRIIETFKLPYTLNVAQAVQVALSDWRENPDAMVASDEKMRIFWDLGDANDPQIIPHLIGMIDADNSPETIYGIGYFGLRQVTGVGYSSHHDGAWWRRWWEKNKGNFPEEIQSIPIPDLPTTRHGANYVALPESLETLAGKVEYLKERIESGDEIDEVIEWIAEEHHDSTDSIPVFIGVIDADNSPETIRAFNYSLRELAGLQSNRFRDGQQLRKWWAQNKQNFAESSQQIPIPDLPKTEYGKQHQPFPDQFQTFDGLYQWLSEADPLEDESLYAEVTEALETAHRYTVRDGVIDPTHIPKLIALIEADNSYSTVYGIGYFALGKLTDVSYNAMNDGAWWRRWWERNREQYPSASHLDIPTLPKTRFGRNYVPLSEDLETMDGLVAWILDGCPASAIIAADDIGDRMREVGGDTSIPFFIEWYEASQAIDDPDAQNYLERNIRHFLRDSIETSIPDDVTSQWFHEYWDARKSFYDAESQTAEIPDLSNAVSKWHENYKAAQDDDDEFADIPSLSKQAGDNDKMRYFQIGPAKSVEMPEDGWKVLVILPGGDGSADFNSFCRRIHKYAIPQDFVVVELVAPVWKEDDNRTVWPTAHLSSEDGDFTTEQFIRDAVKQLAADIEINEDFVFAMGWSSGGPAVYANSLTDESPITGSFVAMSVFRPDWMGALSDAEGHPYFILHSPDDWIDFDDHAKVAESTLDENGATVKLRTYRGGHGWRDNPYAHIRAGVEWLESQVSESD